MRNILITFNGLGSNLGPFTLTADSGVVTPSSATRSQLVSGSGFPVTVDDTATTITITSTGSCSDFDIITIQPCSRPVGLTTLAITYGITYTYDMLFVPFTAAWIAAFAVFNHNHHPMIISSASLYDIQVQGSTIINGSKLYMGTGTECAVVPDGYYVSSAYSGQVFKTICGIVYSPECVRPFELPTLTVYNTTSDGDFTATLDTAMEASYRLNYGYASNGPSIQCQTNMSLVSFSRGNYFDTADTAVSDAHELNIQLGLGLLGSYYATYDETGNYVNASKQYTIPSNLIYSGTTHDCNLLNGFYIFRPFDFFNNTILEIRNGYLKYVHFPKVGSRCGGGVIGYFLRSGVDPGYNYLIPHGLIVKETDLSTNCPWSNGNITNTHTQESNPAAEYGTGPANTDAIIASQGNTGFYAAKLCKDYVSSEGYGDWYLPSLEELVRCVNYRYSIIGPLALFNHRRQMFFDPLVSIYNVWTINGFYWTSNEWSGNVNYAWIQYLGITNSFSIANWLSNPFMSSRSSHNGGGGANPWGSRLYPRIKVKKLQHNALSLGMGTFAGPLHVRPVRTF